MNVAQLREALASEPDDRIVLVSSDEEGNNFHLLTEVSVSSARKDGYCWDLLYDDEDDDEDDEPYEDPEIVVATVLWP